MTCPNKAGKQRAALGRLPGGNVKPVRLSVWKNYQSKFSVDLIEDVGKNEDGYIENQT